jgi:hypothetical protein
MPTAGCKVVVPVQAIQGEDDEYGSELRLGVIAGKVGGYCETRLVPDCDHSPHLQQPAYVLSEITRFVAPLALVSYQILALSFHHHAPLPAGGLGEGMDKVSRPRTATGAGPRRSPGIAP